MLLRRYSSFLHIFLVFTWNMILFESIYHFKKAIFIWTIFLWKVFLFWVIWFTYSSDKMSTLDTIVKNYDKNIVLRDCQRQAFEYLHDKKGDLLVTTFGTFTEIESLQGPTTLYGRLGQLSLRRGLKLEKATYRFIYRERESQKVGIWEGEATGAIH